MQIRLENKTDGSVLEFNSFAEARTATRISPQLFRAWVNGRKPKIRPWSEWALTVKKDGLWCAVSITNAEPKKRSQMKRVELTNGTEKTEYRSILSAAKAAGVSPPTVRKAIESGETFSGFTARYLPPRPGQFVGDRTPERKTCPKCDLDLPASDFYKNKGRPDGLSYACRSCFKADVVERNRRPDVAAARQARRAAAATERINRRIKDTMDSQERGERAFLPVQAE